MKSIQNFNAGQRLAQFGIQATGHIVTAGVVAVLVLAWAITGPLFQLSEWIGKSKNNDFEK